MDFLKILKSFEDFVYEALIWLILLPKTLLRIITSPREMALYAEQELASSDEQRFGDSISPPLLLILCVFIAHLFDLGIRSHAVDTSGSLASSLLASEQNLLLYRTIAFGVWALVGAAYCLIGTGRPIGRQSLRGPFYEQCYLVAPFALVLSVSASLDLAHPEGSLIGASMVLVGTVWFWSVQGVWIRHRLGHGRFRSGFAATVILLAGALVNLLVGMALTRGNAPTDGAGTEAAAPVEAPVAPDDNGPAPTP